jgi:predicted methyltransferase
MKPFAIPRVLCRAATLAALLALGACATHQPAKHAAETRAPAPDYAAIVAAPDRLEADRATDKRRHPEKLLAFYDVRPGMRVLDMGASAGYNAELLARAVGPDGLVYAQNSPGMLQAIVKGRLAERMKRGTMGNVVPLAREFDDPAPADLKNLDLVTFNFVYHDTVHLGVDRAKMNRAIFDALAPGGAYIVADHSAKAGAGTGVAKSLHRIDEAVVRREVEAAGFRYVGSADFLRNPDDPREVIVFKNPVPNDEFVLKFVKPR